MELINHIYKWYAVYTIINHEKKVNEYLKSIGITTYLPLVKKERLWSDRKKVIEAPLFPSYIFVNISNKEYYEVLTHSSALRYVCFNGKAVSIPINQINTIKETINASYNIETGAINYKKGQEICINEGVFSSLVGEIISKEGKKKVLIKIKNIGYSLIIDVPAKYLSNCH